MSNKNDPTAAQASSSLTRVAIYYDMVNVMWVHGEPNAAKEIEEEMKHIRREFGVELPEFFGWPPVDYGKDEFLMFMSDAPDFETQDRLLRRLAVIDPTVKFVNAYCGRFLAPVGTRVAWICGDEVKSSTAEVDVDLSAARDELEADGWDPLEEGEEKFELLVERHQHACLERALKAAEG